MPRAFFLQMDLETVGEEGEKVCRGGGGIGAARTDLRCCNAAKPQAQLVFQNDADDAKCGAAQGEGVLGAGRLLVDGPEAGEKIQLVGERNGHSNRARRHAVGRALRAVMVLDGRRDGGAFALVGGVVAAHQALQLGEFANHAGDEIGLGQTRSAAGFISISAA